ncbi:MAG: response regulator [Planctomycetes bacterium]|nr:response regulator [Planctomycetota bacterium]
MERNRTILHIDDDPSLLKIVSKKLSLSGYDVRSLDDPKQTSRELITTGARLVLLDIDMPDIDGLTLLEDIKRHDGGIQVIMLTGLVSMTTVLQSMRWGAEACVFKPITDIQPLTTAIDAAFEKIDRWWSSLDELNLRKSGNQQTVEAASL